LGACVEASGTGWVLFLSSFLLYGIILTMSIANAFAEQPVSYHTIRVDDLDIFYREAGPQNAPTILFLHGKDDSAAEVHILDAGHFALDLQPQEIIRLTEAFMKEQRFK
jgi:hypothetical protein